MAKDKNYIKLISTRRWRALRLKKLQANPLCQCDVCKEEGKITPATEVHHIVPVESMSTVTDMEKLMFDTHNLMSVSRYCHLKIHEAMKSHSKAYVQKSNERKTQRFIDKFL